MKEDDGDGEGWGAIFEALRSKLGTTSALAISIVVLGLFLLRSNEYYSPVIAPLLVGHWEATARKENNQWMHEAKPTSLTFYDDGVVSLDGLKGSWTFADVSRSAVRIEIPGQRLYELEVRRGESLWGTMRYSGKLLRFNQVERGGAVGVVAEGVEAAIRAEQKDRQELVETACAQTGWRKTAYAAYYWFVSDGSLDCSESGPDSEV